MAKKIRFHADGSPVEIPWPGEGEWTTHRMWEYGTNKACINGWLFTTFTGTPHVRSDARCRIDIPRSSHRFAGRVGKKAQELAVRRGFTGPIDFNNDPNTTDAMRTEFWAELWGSFGYEECP